jgi:hypothetical protein
MQCPVQTSRREVRAVGEGEERGERHMELACLLSPFNTPTEWLPVTGRVGRKKA